MKTIYTNTIKDIGSNAVAFLQENMLITFGENAPSEIQDYIYRGETRPVVGQIKVGQIAQFGDKQYKITAVGCSVQKTLSELGHCLFKFDGSDDPGLSGTICVENKPMPHLTVGDKITILDPEN